MISEVEIITLGIFIATYAVIISEKIHRTVAALLGASIMLVLNIVPWEKVPEYLDLDTILLLAGMMVVVNISKESGLLNI